MVFLAVNNFKKIFEKLDSYSFDKYSNKLDYSFYKRVIGKIMEEIEQEYKKLPIVKKNLFILYRVKKIIDKNTERSMFEQEDYRVNNLTPDDKLGQLNSLSNFDQKLIERNMDELKIRTIFDKKYDGILKNDNFNNIKEDLIIPRNLDEKIQNYFLARITDQEPIDITKRIEQYREQLIINPDEYLKTMSKSIIYTDLIIDSRDRNTDHGSENKYTILLENDIQNIISVELIAAIIPNSEYIINVNNNILCFEETDGTTLTATMTIGNYTLSEMATEIQLQLNSSGSSTYNVDVDSYQRITDTFDENTSRITSNAIDPFKAFDGDIDITWTSSSLPAFLAYEFETPQVVDRYRFICSDADGFPEDWTVDVSNDGVNWLNVDTQTGQVISQFAYNTYTITTNNLATKFVRMRITDSNNSIDVHISELEFFNLTENKLTLNSDLTGGAGIFNLNFEGRTVNTGHNGSGSKVLYKENSIGRLIGFLAQNYSGFRSYTSNNQIIIDRERAIYLFIDNLDAIDTIDRIDSGRYALLPLESERGEYSFFKKGKDWREDYVSEFIYFTDKPINMNKLNIEFRTREDNLYNFYGLSHCLYLRFKHFNSQYNSIQHPSKMSASK